MRDRWLGFRTRRYALIYKLACLRGPPQPSATGSSNMTRHRVGLWLIGAFGGVGTTITLGLAAMARGLADRSGLVTELPLFEGLSLPGPSDFIVGGHDIRQTSFGASAQEFRRAS